MSEIDEAMEPAEAKEELDRAVPFHTLLDVSANKAKAELAHKGALSMRHRPSTEALRSAVMRRSVSAASNFSSTTSFHTVRKYFFKTNGPTFCSFNYIFDSGGQ